ncbi:hypothetical protein [Nocardia sp. CNY236]|uniref:hypothetical protein n=1 Tax=Nocardia sp. CNY236 TaxID=1169152 RepID=UPI000423795A|nr:hypothetical protein [Nocardia sp. CNY236]
MVLTWPIQEDAGRGREGMMNWTHSRFTQLTVHIWRGGTPLNTPPQTDGITTAAEAFAAEITCWRDVAGLAKRALAQKMGFDNTGADPITRYLARISVDRYPGEPEQSRAHYRENPLTWDELGLTATCKGETMAWEVKHDHDAFKELWLLFDNDHGRFPLCPGKSVWIEYSYTVGEDKWGRWFQRAVRLPTARLEVQLSFPAGLDPVVWGIETLPTADARPIGTPPARHHTAGTTMFTWNTVNPPLHTRYRMEWRFRSQTVPGQRHPDVLEITTWATASAQVRIHRVLDLGLPV